MRMIAEAPLGVCDPTELAKAKPGRYPTQLKRGPRRHPTIT
jgi:hypothetical protein